MTQDSTETDDTVGVEVIQEEAEEDISEESSNQEEESIEEVFQEKIIIPSPKVSFDDNDIPIIVNSSASFEERILEASPDATASLCLVPCANCGRKFNEESLERHMKICSKLKSQPRKVFDITKKRLEGQPDVPRTTPRTPTVKKKRPARPEDEYQTCEYCQRKFCPNAYDRHVTWCKEVSTRLQTSPVRDELALSKLTARTQYRPKTPGSGSRCQTSPPRKTSISSYSSEISLPPWNIHSGRTTPNYNSLAKAEGNLRSSKRRTNIMSGTKSLGRADGMRYLREGDASLEPKVEYSPNTAKASTLSRKESGRGSVRRPALTKAALLRQEAGDKKVDKQDKQRNMNNYGPNNNFDFLRSRTPKDSRMTRSMSGAESYRSDRCRSNTVTPQMPRRQSPSVGRPATSPYSWQPSTQSNERAFQPLVKPSAYWPLSSSTRAEPDGIEHEKEDDLGGQYDHSKEYDPFQTAEKQMQELLFGTSGPQSYDVQKPQAVRPSTNSAFSAYVPQSTRNNTSSPSKLRDYSGRNKSPSTNYGKLSSTSDYGLGKMTTSNYGLGKLSSNDYGINSNSSSRTQNSSKARNWTDLFPSLTRTPSTNRQEQQHNTTMARFCHECGNPFPLPHIRFCCECGVKRLYC